MYPKAALSWRAVSSGEKGLRLGLPPHAEMAVGDE